MGVVPVAFQIVTITRNVRDEVELRDLGEETIPSKFAIDKNVF